jgi:hypothetical protein
VPLFENNLSPYLTIVETAEPSAPSAGQQRLYIDPTTHVLKATNSSGVERSVESGSEMDYVQFTGTVSPTATTEASANTIVTATAITFDGTTTVMIEYFAPDNQAPGNAAGSWMQAILFDGSSAIGVMAFVMNEVNGQTLRVPIHAVRRLTPSNASHTYSIRGLVSGGTGVVSVGAAGAGTRVPGYIRITRA